VAVLGTIILFFAYSVFRHQRKRFELQRRSFLAEVAVLEKERTRIATDLHDELGPLLAIAKYQIDHIEDISEDERAHLIKARSHIETVINRLGGIAVNLTPGTLVRKGLPDALKEFIEHYREVSGMNVRFQYQVNSPIPEYMSIHIYRIVQEVLHNAFKHAASSYIDVLLKEKNDTLYLFCKDNGKGFAYDELIKQSKGLGLRSLKSRAEMLRGKMQCESKEGSGTEYFFEIPIKAIDGKEDKNRDR